MVRYLFLLLLLIFGIARSQPVIVINEMMSDNETTIADDEGDYEDWIELFNPGNAAVPLNGIYLSDDPANLMKWAFPSLDFEPQSFLLVFASGRDTIIDGYIHTNFKIDDEGEWLYLSNSLSQVVDSLSPVELANDISWGRRPDGSGSFFLFDLPTPGFSNNLSNSLTFSHGSGFYAEPIDLTITCNDENATIHYTLDGKIPALSSPAYAQSLAVGYRYGEANTISMIPTTPDSAHTDSHHWKPPQGKVHKVNVLRFRTYVGNEPSSDVYTMTYVVDTGAFERYTFPLISIITDPDNLFDDDLGIYVPGNTWDQGDPQWTGNYFQKGSDWERPVHIDFFDQDGDLKISQEAGVRIHGKSTRRRPLKSLKVIARESYGKKEFSYPFFPDREEDKYESILLKSPFGDPYGTIIKDAMTHRLVRPLGFEVSDHQPVIVFINGEYWGFQNFREDQDEDYLESLFDLEKDSLNILENWGDALQGNGEGYQDLIAFIGQNDLSVPENYEYVSTQIDVENYIDYQIAEIYLENYDWPGSNIEFWQAPGYSDRWRWIFFDLDFAWANSAYNMLEHATLEGGTTWPNPDWATFIFRNLLRSDTFRTQFIDRFAELLNTLFKPNNVIQTIGYFHDQFEPEMDNYIKRYGYPQSVQKWNEIIAIQLVKFAEERPCVMEDHIIEFFELDEFAFNCDSSSSPSGEVEEVTIFPNPTKGLFRIQADSWNAIELSLYNSMGQRIFSREYASAMGSQGIQVDVSSVGNGIYLLQIKDEEKVFTSKLMIQK